MSRTGWSELIYVQNGDGPTLTAAAEALLTQDVSIPAGYMVGDRILRAHLMGKASNAVTTPGTLQIRIRWGGIAGVLLADSGALTQNVIVQTNKTWVLDFDIDCRLAGAAGTFLTGGSMQRGNQAAAVVADMTPTLIPASGLALVTVDTTIAKLLSITATPSLTTASITCMEYTLESLN